MRKIVFVFIFIAIVLQVAFAQRGRAVTIYFRDGSVRAGELSKLPNDERFRLQLANGDAILFRSADVRDIVNQDGTRMGINPAPNSGNQPPQNQPQRNQYPPNQQNQQNQQYPPNQQNQQNQQYPPNQQYQQNQQYPPNQQYQQNQQYPPNQQYQQNQQYPPNQQYQQNQQYPPNQQNQQNRPPVKANADDIDADETVDFFDEFGSEFGVSSNKKKAAEKAKTDAPASESNGLGPRGFIDLGYTVGMGAIETKASRIEISASYGSQINPSLFLGVGAGIHLYSDSINFYNDSVSCKTAIPIFVDLRYNFSEGTMIPFVSLKAGYGLGLQTIISEGISSTGTRTRRKESTIKGLGFYLAPAVGVKFMMGSSMAFNLSLGYSVQLKSTEAPTGRGTILKKTEGMGGVTIRAGLEF